MTDAHLGCAHPAHSSIVALSRLSGRGLLFAIRIVHGQLKVIAEITCEDHQRLSEERVRSAKKLQLLPVSRASGV